MIDIVDRLRGAITALTGGKPLMSIPVQETDVDVVMRDAAAEILRLRDWQERAAFRLRQAGGIDSPGFGLVAHNDRGLNERRLWESAVTALLAEAPSGEEAR